MIRINLASIAHEFEKETCSRCYGTGRYSYCQMYGDTCFKCQGKTKVYTKRGAMAQALYKQMASKPVIDLKPGDVIWNDGILGGSGWITLKQVVRGGDGCHTVSPDGGSYDPLDSYTLRFNQTAYHGLSGNTMIRVKQSKGNRLRLTRIALRYQAKLNKAGK